MSASVGGSLCRRSERRQRLKPRDSPCRGGTYLRWMRLEERVSDLPFTHHAVCDPCGYRDCAATSRYTGRRALRNPASAKGSQSAGQVNGSCARALLAKRRRDSERRRRPSLCACLVGEQALNEGLKLLGWQRRNPHEPGVQTLQLRFAHRVKANSRRLG
jgi:hypothetical protein